MTIEFIVLILGIVSSTTLLISALSLHRKRLLIFSLATSAVCAIEYLLVGSFVGLGACIVGMARNSLVLTSLKYTRITWLNHWLFVAAFLGLHTAVFMLVNNWDNTTWMSFLPLIGGWIGTIAVFFKDVMITKVILISGSALWFAYELNSGLYGQMIGEGVYLLGNITAVLLLLRARRHGLKDEEVEDVDTQIINVITSSIPVVTQSNPAVREPSHV